MSVTIDKILGKISISVDDGVRTCGSGGVNGGSKPPYLSESPDVGFLHRLN